MSLSKEQAILLSSTALAFLGDAVHSEYVRKKLLSRHDFKSRALAESEKREVCAASQAKKMEQLLPSLSEDELGVCARAKNAHTNNKAKNAARGQYRLATAYEALLGYLDASGQTERLDEVLEATHDI